MKKNCSFVAATIMVAGAHAAPLTVCDFEDYPVGTTWTLWNNGNGEITSTATVETDPTNVNNKVLHIALKEWGCHPEFKIPTELRGKALTDRYPIVTCNIYTVHLIEVWSHRSHTRLTLIEGLFRIALHITWEVHIAIVVGVYLGCHRQIGRNGIGLDVAVAGMHRHGSQSSIIISVQQLLLDFIGGNAPIIERQIAVLLQLVTQTPKDNRRMVSISLYLADRRVLLPYNSLFPHQRFQPCIQTQVKAPQKCTFQARRCIR